MQFMAHTNIYIYIYIDVVIWFVYHMLYSITRARHSAQVHSLLPWTVAWYIQLTTDYSSYETDDMKMERETEMKMQPYSYLFKSTKCHWNPDPLTFASYFRSFDCVPFAPCCVHIRRNSNNTHKRARTPRQISYG